MKEDWLDKNLGDKLDDYDSPMDLENAWEALQAKRQAPKKKKNFFFLWVIFGMLIIGSAGSYFLFNNATADTLADTKNGVGIQSKISEKIKTDSPTLSPSEKINSDNTTANTLTSKEEQSLTTNKNYENLGLATKNKNYENQNYPDSKKAKSKVDSDATFSKTKNNKVFTPIPNSDFNEKSNTNFITPKQAEEANTTAIDSGTSQKEVQPIATLFLPSLEMSLLELSQMENLAKVEASFSEPYSFPPKVKSNNYFTISSGYGIRSRGKVLAAENPLDVISVNALYEKSFGKSRFYFKTGVNYDQFVNSIERSTEQTLTQQVDNQLIAVNHFQNGTSEDVFGVAKVQTIEKTTSKNFNRYRLISVPLILGLDVISSKKISLQVEGGMARSIFGNHSGKDFDLIEADFENQGVWQGLYGLNLNYNLSRNLNIFSSLKGNYHLNKIGKSEQLEMEKFRFHQIQVGLRFKL